MRVAYLGPKGTFNHYAAKRFLPDTQIFPFASINAVFEREKEFDGVLVPYTEVAHFCL